jgi:hypothetical protein
MYGGSAKALNFKLPPQLLERDNSFDCPEAILPPFVSLVLPEHSVFDISPASSPSPLQCGWPKNVLSWSVASRARGGGGGEE